LKEIFGGGLEKGNGVFAEVVTGIRIGAGAKS
jgi:hypothetical protein